MRPFRRYSSAIHADLILQTRRLTPDKLPLLRDFAMIPESRRTHEFARICRNSHAERAYLMVGKLFSAEWLSFRSGADKTLLIFAKAGRVHVR
jgi:hypothetical protein